MKSFDWYRWDTRGESRPHRLNAIATPAIGFAVGLLFFLAEHQAMAILVWSIAGVVTVMPLLWPRAGAALERFLLSLGRSAGRIVGILLLTPVFIIVFPVIRILNHLAGRDPLHLRDGERHTFWLESGSNRRKRKHVSSMFAAEPPSRQPRGKLAFAAALACVVLLIELSLRVLGLGSPILYIDDPVVGYYPGPDQAVHRYGNKLVATNRFGMRAPDYTPEKPAGRFRILMIGDSTLWGGSYMAQDGIYARLMEKRLNELSEGSPIEVLNIGVNGWGPFHKMGYVEKFGSFDADVAIVCMPIGDVKRPFSRLYHLPYFPVHSPPRLALEEVFLKLVWRYQAKLAGSPSPEALALQIDRGMAAYLDLAERLRETGCEVLFEVLPSRTAGTSTHVPQREQTLLNAFRQVLARGGFDVHCPTAFAADVPGADPDDLYHDACHLHWLGHQLYADYLAERIVHQSRAFGLWSGRRLKTVVKSGAGL